MNVAGLFERVTEWMSRDRLREVVHTVKEKRDEMCIAIDAHGNCTLHVAFSKNGSVVPVNKCGNSKPVPVAGPDDVESLVEEMQDNEWGLVQMENSWFHQYDIPGDGSM